ncbi:hypothetical protein CsatB_007300 [Cannabis sativa]
MEKHVQRNDLTREPKAHTRVDCKVAFRVHRVIGENTWICREFITTHSHALPADNHKQFLRSNRVVTAGYVETATLLREAGVKTYHILSYMAIQVGGYEKMPFTKSDIYNKISNMEQVRLSSSDARRAIGYLEQTMMIDFLEDTLFIKGTDFNTYFGQMDGHNLTMRLLVTPLLWIQPTRPMHKENHNESAESYIWAAQQFLECMNGVHPKTVVTDSDPALKTMVEETMPDTIHRLCYWHMHNNAVSNVTDPGFAQKLTQLVFKYYEEEVFEAKWAALVTEYILENTRYANDLYERRKNWAETFLRGNFFCGMSTTQHSEGVNALLKKKLNRNLKLYVFVRAVDMSLSLILYREAKDDYDRLHTTPQLGKTSFHQIEKYLSNVYTRNMYYKVREEMVKEARYLKESKIQTDNGTLLELLKYPECRIRRVVLVSSNNKFFVCECQHFLSFGIPCRHVFAAMKYMKVQDIRKSLLVTRWTKTPYGDEKVETKHYRECENASTEVQARFSRITTKMAEVAYIGAKTHEAYYEILQLLENMSISLQKYDKVENKRGREEEKIKQNDITVEDPHISKTKGIAKMRGSKAVNKRKCTICKKSGHNKKICPQTRTKRADEDEDFGNQYDDETEQSDDVLESDNGEERLSDEEMFDQSQRQTSTLPLEDDNVGHKQYTYSTPTSMETWSQWWGSAY